MYDSKYITKTKDIVVQIYMFSDLFKIMLKSILDIAS